MTQQYTITNEEKIPSTHFFIYKNDKYPFNLDFFKYISKYFFQNQESFQNSTTIELVDKEYEDKVNLSKDLINDFIYFCHNHEIQIHNQNVIGLNYLAKKYEVSSLLKKTEYYISIHTNELLIQKLSLFNEIHEFETEKYEDMIAEKFNDYIDDNSILSLSIPVLHRILTKYLVKNKSVNIFPFLFKCLDKYGRCASVLFSNVDYGDENAKNLNILLTKYSKIFDFNFIGSSLTKTLYETQNDFIQKEEKIEKEQKDILNFVNAQMNKTRKEMNKMKDEYFNEIQNQKKINEGNVKALTQQINHMNEEIDKMKIEHKNEIAKQKENEEEIINKFNNQIKQINKEMSKMKIEHKNEIDKQKKKEEDSINKLTNQMQVEINKIKEEHKSEILEKQKIIEENIGKLNQQINLMKSDVNKIKAELTNYYNNQINKEKEKIDTTINNINILKRISIHNINIEAFNKLDGDIQEFVINDIISRKKTESISKIHSFISYLVGEYNNLHMKFDKSNRIFIPTQNMDDKIKSINTLNNEINQIGISKNIVETFYKYKIDSEKFKSKSNQFNQLFLEVQYPSPYFDEVLNHVKNTNIKIIVITSNLSQFSNKINACSNIFSVIIENSIDTIDNDCFNKCSSLTQITIPHSVTSIQNSAFSGCSSLTEISIPSSVTSIGNSVFSGCSSLKQISIPSSVTSIKENAFDKCSSLVQITIPSSVMSIGQYSFRECLCLKQITIPSSINSIDQYIFERCISLTLVTIPNSVKSIGNGAFRECSSLTKIEIPTSVKSIGKAAFFFCTSLTQISLPPSLKLIEKNTFRGCSLLRQITLPSSIISINYGAFSKCTLLSEIMIPKSVTLIGCYAFSECSSLGKVSFEDSFSLTTINESAFFKCTSIKQLAIPSSVATIKDCAFKKCSSLENVTIHSATSTSPNSFPPNTKITKIEN